MTAFDLALRIMESLHDSEQSDCFGTTLVDAYLPILEMWIAGQDISLVLVCYEDSEFQERAILSARALARNGDYPCGVIAGIINTDLVMLEVTDDGLVERDWSELSSAWPFDRWRKSR